MDAAASLRVDAAERAALMAAHLMQERRGDVLIVTLNRPESRNPISGQTAHELYDAFTAFDRDDSLAVAVLTGAGEHFCAGADLKAVASGEGMNPIHPDGDMGPEGCTRLRLSKPVIAAVEGYAVAGGLELALWCDLRVASDTAIFGVFCRRFGVPLIDLGTYRLPRLIGQSRAMDLILTGRAVDAHEAERIGLANRRVPAGQALPAAVELAEQLAALPQRCMRNDRLAVLEGWGLEEDDAMRNEMQRGLDTLKSGESVAGATAFTQGQGRHGGKR